MEFEALPVDVLVLFLDHLPQRDLKKVRLVCRFLHKLVQLRIPRVFLSPNRANIDAFLAICAHSVFRDQVQEIIWDDARLEFYEREKLSPMGELLLSEDLRMGDGDFRSSVEKLNKRFQHFSKKITDQTEFMDERFVMRREELWGPDVRDMSLEDSFNLYNRLYDEQQAIIEAGEDVETLVLGLVSFPSLKRLTVSSEAWRIKPLFPRYETPFFRSLPPGFQMPQPWPWLGRDYDDLSEDQLDKLMEPWDDDHEVWRGYEIVIDALLATVAHHNVEEFVVDTNYEFTGISYQLFASPQCSGYTKTWELFQTLQLTTLELSLNVQTADQFNFPCFHNGLLKKSLSQLRVLKHLTLSASIDHFDDEFDSDESWLNIEEILPTDVLAAKLESLKLCNMLIHGRSLFDSLSSLGSLQLIWLDCIALSDPCTWRDFTFRIRDELVRRPSGKPWTRDNPTMVVRRKNSLLNQRLDSTAVLCEFLHGEGECPFTVAQPRIANVGWYMDNFDPEDKYCMLRNEECLTESDP